MIVAPEGFFADCPIWAITQPTEMEVNSSRSQRSFEAVRHAIGPARPLIALFTLTHECCRPFLSIRQRCQIDFPGGDGGRFPVHHEKAFIPHQHSLGVKLAVDNCRSASQEWIEPAIVGPAKFDQPGETLLKGSRELECPRCPSAVVLGVVPYQKGERGIINACLMMGVKSPQPAGCLRHRARLAPGPLRTDVAQAPEAVNVFEKKRRFTGLRIRVCAQALGSESGQWPQ